MLIQYASEGQSTSECRSPEAAIRPACHRQRRPSSFAAHRARPPCGLPAVAWRRSRVSSVVRATSGSALHKRPSLRRLRALRGCLGNAGMGVRVALNHGFTFVRDSSLCARPRRYPVSSGRLNRRTGASWHFTRRRVRTFQASSAIPAASWRMRFLTIVCWATSGSPA